MSDYYKVTPTACHCGGTQAWVRLRDGMEEMVGCICHNVLPFDAKIIGDYIDRPYKDDPLPLNDLAARKQWKRRNFLRNYSLDSYRPPPEL